MKQMFRSQVRRGLAMFLAMVSLVGVLLVVSAPGASADEATARDRILREYVRMGAQRGILGNAVEDVQIRSAGDVWGQRFQGGEIVWAPTTRDGRAHAVSGSFIQYLRVYSNRSVYPYIATTDEVPVRGGVVQVFWNRNENRFFHMYWSPRTGPHYVAADFMDTYKDLNYENGPLGFPSGDLLTTPNKLGYYQTFQGGVMYRKKTEGNVDAVYGKWLQTYAALGYENSCLGFPVSPVRNSFPRGEDQYFENAKLVSPNANSPATLQGFKTPKNGCR